MVSGVAPCTVNWTEFVSPTHITGKVLEQTSQLELAFTIGQATTTGTASCREASATKAGDI